MEGFGQINLQICNVDLVRYEVELLCILQDDIHRILRANGMKEIPSILFLINPSSDKDQVSTIKHATIMASNLRNNVWRKKYIPTYNQDVTKAFRQSDMWKSLMVIENTPGTHLQVKIFIKAIYELQRLYPSISPSDLPRTVVRLQSKNIGAHINYNFDHLFTDIFCVNNMSEWISSAGLHAIYNISSSKSTIQVLKHLNFDAYRLMLLSMHPVYGYCTLKINKSLWYDTSEGAKFFDFFSLDFLSTFRIFKGSLWEKSSSANIWYSELSDPLHKVIVNRMSKLPFEHLYETTLSSRDTQSQLLYWPVGFPHGNATPFHNYIEIPLSPRSTTASSDSLRISCRQRISLINEDTMGNFPSPKKTILLLHNLLRPIDSRLRDFITGLDTLLEVELYAKLEEEYGYIDEDLMDRSAAIIHNI